MGERRLCKPEAGGSSPPTSTSPVCCSPGCRMRAFALQFICPYRPRRGKGTDHQPKALIEGIDVSMTKGYYYVDAVGQPAPAIADDDSAAQSPKAPMVCVPARLPSQ